MSDTSDQGGRRTITADDLREHTEAERRELTARELRDTMNGCGLALAAVDSAVRKASGYEGPPGSGLHRILSAMAAQLGVRAGAMPAFTESERAELAADVERRELAQRETRGEGLGSDRTGRRDSDA